MKDIKTLIREGLNNYINEAEGKKTKEQEIPLPKGCFGGPKSELGALVSLIELLSKEKHTLRESLKNLNYIHLLDIIYLN
jgi:hypothetical protein